MRRARRGGTHRSPAAHRTGSGRQARRRRPWRTPLHNHLSGAEEVDPITGDLGAGDPNGSGLATLTVNPGQEEVCYGLSVEGITLPATGAHIHMGDAGENGPVVVPLTPPDASGVSSGCTDVSRELALEIIRNPENYYVNVHTTDFPSGAIRGQLP